MFRKKFLLISLFFILIMSAASVSASQIMSDIENDTNSGDLILSDVESHTDSANILLAAGDDNGYSALNENSNTLKPTGNTFEDIQESIDNASENNIILLDGSYIGSGVEIKVNKTLTLMSQNQAILDANASSRIFNITAPNVVLIGLNFINGLSPEGGAIHSTNTLEIYNSSFKDNYADRIRTIYGEDEEGGYYYSINTAYGGAIFSNSTLIVENTLFRNNHPHEGILSDRTRGGAIYSGNVELKLTEKFKDDSDKYVEWPSAGGDLTIRNCNFTENENAIQFYGNLTLESSKFVNNSKSIIDSEVFDPMSRVSIKSCDFIDNIGNSPDNYVYNLISCGFEYCHDSLISDCKFINNKYFYSLLYAGINATVNSSDFINNYVYVGGAISALDNLTVIGCLFANNYADNLGLDAYGTGGAIYALGRLNVSNSVFENNTARFGGAIYSNSFKYYYDDNDDSRYELIGSDVTVTNSSFKNNLEGAVVLRNGGKITIDKRNISSKSQISLDNSLKSFALIKVLVNDFTTSYNSTKPLTVKLVYRDTNKAVANFIFYLSVKINGKTLKYSATTNKNGVATFNKVSLFAVGTHSVSFISSEPDASFAKKTVKVKIIKASTIVSAPKVTAKYKKSRYFKATVKNKATKKVLKGIKIKIKVYTGKKYKTYTVKTNSKGIAQINTKSLKKGKHKVVISSANSNYIISKTSYIVIK